MQAGILAATGIIVRIIGLLYRSPLTAIIGDEGNGYYGYAYNCYMIALLISSYSIPSAVSKIISGKLAVGQYIYAQRTFRAAMYYVAVIGGIISLVLMIFARSFVTDPNAVPVLRIFAPTVFLFGVLGVLRGYFQAHKTMVQTSISQILEQIGNALISILMALILRSTVSLPEVETEEAMAAYQTSRAVRGAMGSALGTGAGVLIALVFMVMLYMANRPYVHDRVFLDMHAPAPMTVVMKRLVSYVTPFLLSTLVYNMTTLLNQTIYTRVMIGARGMEGSLVASEYGIFSGKAVLITNIPIAIAAAVSSAMIPEISAKYARKKRKAARSLAGEVIRMTMLIAIPSTVGLIALARPVTMLLFPQQASLAKASYLLMALAVTVALYSFSTLTNAILQSAGKPWTPVINSLIAITLQAFLLWLLLYVTPLGIYAMVIALILHAVLTCLLNQMSISRYRLATINVRLYFFEPLEAAFVMGICCFVVYFLLQLLLGLVIPGAYFVNLISVLPAILTGVYAYAFVLLRTGTVTKEELRRFPRGETLYRIACATGIYAKKRRRTRTAKSYGQVRHTSAKKRKRKNRYGF